MTSYPTDRLARNEAMCREMREWYEEHRERWWTRWRKPYVYDGTGTDEFMQALITKMREVFDAVKADEQQAARARKGIAMQPKGKPPLRFKRTK